MTDSKTTPGPTPPTALKKIQHSMGLSIQTPLIIDKTTGDYEVQVDRYDALVLSQMVAHETLSGPERLATYNQQYWFRFLEVMREEYPLLDDLMGSTDFNRMVTAYLSAFPSSSPTLRYLSVNLSAFLNQEHEWKSDLNVQCSVFEYAFIDCFDAAHLAPLKLENIDEQDLMNLKLGFQPHWNLVSADYDLLDMRRQIKAGKSGIQTTEKKCYWAIYRKQKKLQTFELGPIQFSLLSALQTLSFGDALDKIASDLDDQQLDFLIKNVKLWFALWASESWFV